ncbi:MAG: GNAT family N-acetyltransferase [Sphaerochaetaceae bacterium]|nr:GNAT family N-acetyltransferase [Sphaerochaetaceae bacterium]
METASRFVDSPIRTERLVLTQPYDVPAEEVRHFFIENKAFHASWEPLREPSFYELESIRRMLVRQGEENRGERALTLYLMLPGEQQVIGSISLTNIIYGPFLSCFLGYRMARSETSRGYMTEALRALIDIAFGRYGLHRIEANIMPANHASVRLVENLGFINEGYSSRYLCIAGVWEGHCHHVLLNDEPIRT